MIFFSEYFSSLLWCLSLAFAGPIVMLVQVSKYAIESYVRTNLPFVYANPTIHKAIDAVLQDGFAIFMVYLWFLCVTFALLFPRNFYNPSLLTWNLFADSRKRLHYIPMLVAQVFGAFSAMQCFKFLRFMVANGFDPVSSFHQVIDSIQNGNPIGPADPFLGVWTANYRASTVLEAALWEGGLMFLLCISIVVIGKLGMRNRFVSVLLVPFAVVGICYLGRDHTGPILNPLTAAGPLYETRKLNADLATVYVAGSMIGAALAGIFTNTFFSSSSSKATRIEREARKSKKTN